MTAPTTAEKVGGSRTVAVSEETTIDLSVRWRHSGPAILLIGLAVWAGATAVTAVTRDPILIPMVIVAGSFAVPLGALVWLLQREDKAVGQLPPTGVMVTAFLGAGTVGVLLSALLENYLLPLTPGTSVVVGLVEEGSKGLIIVLAARQMRSREPLEGMILGAIVGAGFAAFETAGYAFTSYVTNVNHARFLSLVETELDRALLAPVGHMLWSAILGGVLFAAVSGHRRFRLTTGVWATFAGVAALHAFWDQASGWAIMSTLWLTGGGWHLAWPDAVDWTTQPTHNQVNLFNVVDDGLLLLAALIGMAWFGRRWHRYKSALGSVRYLSGRQATAPGSIIDV
jgi:RsiW-degrading membrane proteinase PrsW (M82 family)